MRSQIPNIGKISVFLNSRQIVPQNEALEQIIQKISLEVNRGPLAAKAKPLVSLKEVG